MPEHLINLRQSLHQYPELAGEEKQTAESIRKYLSKLKNAEIISNIGGHGMAVVFNFSMDGPVVLLRAELDALPIPEENNFSYKSVIEGKSHKCGHEGHMTILCGIAEWLDKSDLKKGKVILLFQPAEETGEGAERVLKDDVFINKLQPDYAFALHNLPGYNMHDIVVIDGVFTPDVRSLGIYLKGLKSHACEPEKGINPSVCISELVLELDKLNHPQIQSPDFALLTPVYGLIGSKAYGISAGDGEIHYTIRTASKDTMQVLINNIKSVIKKLTDKHNLSFKINWFDHFPLTINHSLCNEIIRKAAVKNEFTIVDQEEFIKFGEDFGWFSQNYPSSMFGIGAGKETPPLHNPAYDFPDELIPTGINMFKGIIEEILD